MNSVVQYIAVLFTFLSFGAVSAIAQNIIYVKKDATGANNGTSWTDAYTSLQDALAAATSGDEIWVAAGTYYPDEGAGLTDNDRALSFSLKTGVSLYGGFAGTETERSQRDWQTNPTLLSGDIDQNDVDEDGDGFPDVINGSNSYHVVEVDYKVSKTKVDGFIILNGYANGPGSDDDGGGIHVFFGEITIANSTIINNQATNYAGGIYGYNSTMDIYSSTIKNNKGVQSVGGVLYFYSAGNIVSTIVESNTTNNYGGGIYLQDSNPRIDSVMFIRNEAITGGGALYNSNSSPHITNSKFIKNKAAQGAGIYNLNSNAIIEFSEFTQNDADEYGGGVVNHSSRPQITSSTFESNIAPNGGAIMNYSDSNAKITNVLILNNVDFQSATKKPFKIAHKEQSGQGAYKIKAGFVKQITTHKNILSKGGGIYNYYSDPTIINAAILSNKASSGSGIYNDFGSNPKLINSLLFNDASGDCSGYNFDSTSRNNIFQSNQACGLINGQNNNKIGVDPRLVLLQNTALRYSLLNDSPALDAGDDTVCPSEDLRGNTRPVDGNEDGIARCDIGAIEFNPTELEHTPTAPQIVEPPQGAEISVSRGDAQDITIVWRSSEDEDGDKLYYRWELASNNLFTQHRLQKSTQDTLLTWSHTEIISYLETLGMKVGDDRMLYHRVWVTDSTVLAGGTVVEVASTPFNFRLVLENTPPAEPEIVAPAPGAKIAIKKSSTDALKVRWKASYDPDNQALTYRWELGKDSLFSEVYRRKTTQDTTTSIAHTDLAQLLDSLGVEIGASRVFYHRIIANDGFADVPGAPQSLTLIYENTPPTVPEIVEPAAGADIVVSRTSQQPLIIRWRASYDPDEQPLTYRWELAGDWQFAAIYRSTATQDTSISLNRADLAALLDSLGVKPGSAKTLYHRIVVSDGFAEVESSPQGIRFLLENSPPTAPEIVEPAPGTEVVIEGDPTSIFRIAWRASLDADGDTLNYRWELGEDSLLTTLYLQRETQDTVVTFTYRQIADLLDSLGVTPGSGKTFYHRAIASDGIAEVPGPASSVRFVRGALTANEAQELPSDWKFLGYYPNPVQGRQIHLIADIPVPTNITITIYDMLGRQIYKKQFTGVTPGKRKVLNLETPSLASGLYVYRLLAQPARGERQVITGKLLWLQ